MDSIASIINNIDFDSNRITRFRYMPYSEKVALSVWNDIAGKFIIKKDEGRQQLVVWNNLIKYVHGDDKSAYDLNKSICLMGQTGSGKTITLKIMSEYMKIDNVMYMRGKTRLTFNYRMVSSSEIISNFMLNGFDGIAKYLIIGNLCIDDLGAEAQTATHYGNKIDVIAEIIEARYNKGLLTHFTTNLNENLILERYDSRVHSRILHSCNMIRMSDKDFRIYKDEEKF